MANLNACNALGEKLAKASAALEAMLASGEDVASPEILRLRKEASVFAADYLAAWAEPQPIKAYSPWKDGIGR